MSVAILQLKQEKKSLYGTVRFSYMGMVFNC